MITANNLHSPEHSIDAVVLAGKSNLIVQDKSNIRYSSFPIFPSCPSTLYHTKIVNPHEPMDKAGIDYKAIIPIDNKPMVSYVVEALAESDYVNNIYIVGEEDKLNKINFSRGKEKIRFVDDQGSFVDNLIEGGNKSKSKKILYSTSDIPLITNEDVNNFIRECSHREDSHFYLAYYLKEDYEKSFSGAKSSRFYQFRGEKFVKNGYLFMLDRGFLDDINKNKDMRNIIAFLYSGRKKRLWPYLKLAYKYPLFASLSLIIKYKRRTLAIDEAEKLLSRIIKYNIVAIKSSPEVGVDVDSYEELQNIEKIIKKNKSYIKSENIS